MIRAVTHRFVRFVRFLLHSNTTRAGSHVETRVRAQASPYESGQGGTGTGFSPRPLVSLVSNTPPLIRI